MSKNKRDPNCTCVKGRMGSYVNCPVHNPYKNKHLKSTDMTDNQEQKPENDFFQSLVGAEQLRNKITQDKYLKEERKDNRPYTDEELKNEIAAFKRGERKDFNKIPRPIKEIIKDPQTLSDYNGVFVDEETGISGRSIQDLEAKLAAHKTRVPVVNKLNMNNFPFPSAEELQKKYAAQDEGFKWLDIAIKNHKGISDVLNFCHVHNLTTDQLLEQATRYQKQNPLSQAWVFEVLAYCSDLGIDPMQLIEQHKGVMLMQKLGMPDKNIDMPSKDDPALYDEWNPQAM